MKVYYHLDNVGKARYVGNYHDGAKVHSDGSPFYDIAIFKSKKAREGFITNLKALGYRERLGI
jgi:hypothetical protein